MPGLEHDHPIDAHRVAETRDRVLSAAGGERIAEAMRLLADPVRARIVSALHEAGELCVGDLALVLGVSDSSVSHALRRLRTAGVVSHRRDGRVIYNRLTDPKAARILDMVTRDDDEDG